MARSRRRIWLIALILIPGSVALGMQLWPGATEPVSAKPPPPLKLKTAEGMILLPGGAFLMGSATTADLDAQPLHRVRLAPFWLDRTPVTNREFQRFAEQTGYVTVAERVGSSLVFDRKSATWRKMTGASWRHPEGASSSLVGREQHPVVQVTWQDAAAYAAATDKRLPTEAEFEYAARGGLSDAAYPWGRELTLGDRHLANGWQGTFPEQDTAQDGFHGTSPVGHFPPNRFGLHDMAGNVWQWCADWYAADYYAASLTDQPRGSGGGDQRVRRGGSWLSTIDYEGNLRTAHRGHAPPGESTNHTGFRCAKDATSL